MNASEIEFISARELMMNVKAGVSKKDVWKKPLLLLTKNGTDYNYIHNELKETYDTMCINTEPNYYEFVRVDDTIKASFNGVIINNRHPDVDIFIYLGECLAYDEKIHRYCVGLLEYEAKPVISLICVSVRGCSVLNIPEWMEKEFEIVMLR